MASQLCFEAETLKHWLEQTRLAGITLPLQIGVAGVVDLAKLLSISTRIGVGDSIRYFTKHTGNVLKLMGGYKPGDLLDKLVPIYADPYFNIEGFHIYTFNNLQKTEAWRKQKLKTLGMS
jgi:methylenetetrahydrofolate reductase (NADPH)